MSEVVTLAEKVVAELEEYNAELSFFPEFELRDLDEMRVVVVPVGTQYKTLSRSSHEELPRVQIGILKRGSEEELPELLKFVEGLGLGFLNSCRTMSMFNTQVICMTCKEKEQQRADYRKAVEADHAEIRKGNYNFQGIGLDD